MITLSCSKCGNTSIFYSYCNDHSEGCRPQFSSVLIDCEGTSDQPDIEAPRAKIEDPEGRLARTVLIQAESIRGLKDQLGRKDQVNDKLSTGYQKELQSNEDLRAELENRKKFITEQKKRITGLKAKLDKREAGDYTSAVGGLGFTYSTGCCGEIRIRLGDDEGHLVFDRETGINFIVSVVTKDLRHAISWKDAKIKYLEKQLDRLEKCQSNQR